MSRFGARADYKKTAKTTVFGPSRLYFSADFDKILDYGVFLVALQLRFT